MRISLDRILLHLSVHKGDSVVGATVKLRTDGIEEYVEQLIGREFPPGVSRKHLGIAEQPWGSQDMLLVDPFGNRLIFTNADFKSPV